MPSLPIPAFAALMLAWLLLRALVRGGAPVVFLALLALCAAQSLLTALSLHYGLVWADLIRPISAGLIPPLGWMAFATTALRGARSGDLAHGIGPAFVVFCRLTQPSVLDVAIPALYLGYGAAILWVLHARAGDLPRLGLGAGERPGQIWRAIGWALIGSAVSDAMIAGTIMAGRSDLVPWIVSVASSATVFLIGALALTPDIAPDPCPDLPEPDAETVEAQAALIARLGELLTRDRLYLDPDLTLNRLARRLHVPAKRLSEAINRQTGGNVARLINGMRIQAACEVLATGQSVTEAMLVSGFNTKSNFNRAFRIATGTSPSDWRAVPPLRDAPPGATFGT